jgi:hypothetical protein
MKKQIQYKIIDNYLTYLNSKLSSNEREHLKKLIPIFFNTKCVSTLVKIIVRVEENRVPIGQDLGCFTQELINLVHFHLETLSSHSSLELDSSKEIVPLQERVKFCKFAKRQRILALDAKLRKTFKAFGNLVF